MDLTHPTALETEVDDLWIGSTPAVVLRVATPPGFNDRLAAIVLAREREVLDASVPTPIAGLQEGMTTHWQSYNVLNWPEPEPLALRGVILRGISEFVTRHCPDDDDGHQIVGISCWANVLRSGEGLSEHTHAPSYLLGNYLVRAPAGDPAKDAGGATRYRSPDPGLAAEVVVAPREGQLIVCRGDVPHEVVPHTTAGERISIAFDCIVKKQNALLYLGDPRALEPYRGPRWYAPPGQRLLGGSAR
ncbi:MAG: putative 2OG-Fe(II) oxygenase [Actinomycetota bacterium]